MTKSKKRRRKNVVVGRTIPMLSVSAISKKYDFHPNTVRSWVSRDGLRHVRHGKGNKIFIRKSDVERFIGTWYEED
jgi:uncharacterized protein YjcR